MKHTIKLYSVALCIGSALILGSAPALSADMNDSMSDTGASHRTMDDGMTKDGMMSDEKKKMKDDMDKDMKSDSMKKDKMKKEKKSVVFIVTSHL